MSELELVRRLAPPVDPPTPVALARMRARATGRRARRTPRPRWLLAPLATAAALALVVVLFQAGGGGQERAFAAETVRAAEGAPRLLLGGWTVTRVDEWSAGTGEMTFSQGDRQVELSWLPTRSSGPKVGAAKDPDPGVELEVGVPGGRAVVNRYPDSDDYTAVWRAGDLTVQARAIAPSPDDFAGVLRRLEQVDARAWLRALPASAVTPSEQRDAVDEMLAGLPLPPGFDAGSLRGGAATRDRYQLGAKAAGAVACGWLATWAEAKAAGDDAGVRRAVVALASSRDWAILREMNAEGDYPEVVWEYADAVAGDGTVMGGKRLGVEESYKSALCG
ncbi:MAG TPA: hypothetical protein VK631_04385 [Solirubrobacteraceae bacterium]|nr:hypothetical protein [Solirubrobacteraceae bacterium]